MKVITQIQGMFILVMASYLALSFSVSIINVVRGDCKELIVEPVIHSRLFCPKQ